MPLPSAHVATAPRLVGRGDALGEILDLAGTRPGAIVVVGEAGVGASRTTREAAARLALDGSIVVPAEEPGPGAQRLEAALREAGHTPDPAGASRLRPLVVLLGDRPGEPALAGELARRLAGTRTLVLLTAREVPSDAPAVVLERLGRREGALLADAASPGLEPAATHAIAALGDGLPGRIVPLALAARRWKGGEAPLPVPAALRSWAHARLEALEAWPRDLAGWVAVVSAPATPEAIARVCREGLPRIERGLEALVRAGVLEEIPPPPVTRWAFRDQLVRAVVSDDLGGAELRRRHASALVAGRSAGQEPAELLRHSLGAADQPAVVSYRSEERRVGKECRL